MLSLIRIYTLLLVVMISVQGQASGQDVSASVKIFGKVVVVADSSGLFFFPPNLVENDPYALPGANVILLDMDSTMIMGAVTGQRTGLFELTEIPPGDYMLKTSYIGYPDKLESIKIDNTTPTYLEITLGEIYSDSELPFHEAHARDDLSKGIVQFKRWGDYVGGPHPLEDKALQEKFGFTVDDLNQRYDEVDPQLWDKLRQASIRYNRIVNEYLTVKYPNEWESLHRIW